LPLGDHGFVGEHRPWLHEELVHLPLLVKLPGGKQAGRRVQHFTQPVDLLPTLLDAFGVNKEATDGDISSPGRSLLKLSRGEPTRLLEYACSVARLRGHEEWSIRTHQWHLIVPVAGTAHPSRNPLLYVKPDDRWEVNNVLSQHPDVAEHLELALRRFLGAAEDGMNALPELRAEVLKPQ
jgi:arylsulfatase A-like enzyme